MSSLRSAPHPTSFRSWARLASHTAAMRFYWLCAVVGEPGIESTPFWNGTEAIDWADDLDHPHPGDEIATAMDSTFAIVDGCLDRWTFDMLTDEIERHYLETVQVHTRSSILQRLFFGTRRGTGAKFCRRSASTGFPSPISGAPTRPAGERLAGVFPHALL